MESKGIFYTVIEQLGKGAGSAEKVIVNSKSWLLSLGGKLLSIRSNDEINSAEILEKTKNEGELIVLAVDELKEFLKDKSP
jgi:hypothetical protein